MDLCCPYMPEDMFWHGPAHTMKGFLMSLNGRTSSNCDGILEKSPKN